MKQIFLLNGENKEELENRPFEDEVREMQEFFKENIHVLGKNFKFIADKVSITVGGSYREVDILALDLESKAPVVIELKKDEADENVLLQVLRYASWVANNPDSVKYLLTKAGFKHSEVDDIDFNNIRIIIVAERFKDVLLSLSQYISGFQIDFVKYGRYLRPNKGEEIIVIEYIQPPREFSKPVKSPMAKDFETYIERYRKEGVKDDYIDVIKQSYKILEEIISEKDWKITPALNEWYIAFQIKGPINNIFEIHIKKTKSPEFKIRLGPDFNPEEVGLSAEEFSRFKQDVYKEFWKTEITNPEDIYNFEKLLESAYYKYTSG